ncbi:MAG TPA: TonB-dependent receptor [Steroidobacteraceae bacterium]
MFRKSLPRAHRRAFASVLFIELLALHAAAALADDELQPSDALSRVIVSATRLPTPEDEIASSVTLITAADIEAQQARTLPDILQRVPGLNIVQSGGVGAVTSIFMRGTNSNHVKIYVDGIDVADPSTPADAFNLANLQLADIDRIEVLRGPQSGLYGSDAIGGAISIVTKPGAGPAQLAGSLEGGSFGTFNQTASLSGSTTDFNYVLNADHLRSTDSLVTPLDVLAPGEQRNPDSYDNKSFSTKLGAQLTTDLDVRAVARYVDTTLLFTNDDFFDSIPDAVRSREDAQQLYTRASAHLALFAGRFDETLGVGYSLDRTSDSGPEAAASVNRGDRLKVDWQGNIKLADTQVLTVGAEHERDAIQASPISASTTVNSGFAQLQSGFDAQFFDTVSVRYDNNDRFGGKTTYRIAPAHIISATGTTFKGSVGSGFKAPTLNQLFVSFPAFGFLANPDLKPETSVGYDVGFEQALFLKRLNFGVTYFHNHIRDLINGNDTFSSDINVGRATTYGTESFVAYTPVAQVALRADFTHTIARDDILDVQLLRRPRTKVSFSGTWQASNALSLSTTVVYVGPWADGTRETFTPVTAGGYGTTNIAANYALSPKLSLFARINNLFDRRYEDPVGFDHPGLGLFAGVNAVL